MAVITLYSPPTENFQIPEIIANWRQHKSFYTYIILNITFAILWLVSIKLYVLKLTIDLAICT